MKYDTNKRKLLIKNRKKHCDIISRMYYLKITFKGPEYTRNIVSFYDSLADFLKYQKIE